jgi:D-proline reductase (dithiol) PrdB
MPFELEKLKADFKRWVETYRSDFEAGHTKAALKEYPFVITENIPWTPFSGEPSEKTFALITSGGLYIKDGQPAFEPFTIYGDASFREIPRSIRFEDLGIAHGHYDPRLAEEDINTIFPIHRFIELEQEGIIGKLAGTHYSFSYVNDMVGLITESAPQVLDRIKAQGVDVLFLVPV